MIKCSNRDKGPFFLRPYVIPFPAEQDGTQKYLFFQCKVKSWLLGFHKGRLNMPFCPSASFHYCIVVISVLYFQGVACFYFPLLVLWIIAPPENLMITGEL